MAKAKKVDKSKDRRTLKYFTEATVKAIDDALEGISVDDLINNIYLKSDDKVMNYYIVQYEKQLILSRINHEEFRTELHKFYLEMAKHIRNTGSYKEFFALSYMQNVAICKRDINKGLMSGILSGCQDLLVQQYPYLTGSSKKVVCGLDKYGRLMTVPEVKEYLTEINYELHIITLNEQSEDFDYEDTMLKIFRKYWYIVNSSKDCYEIIAYDQMITNMLYFMAIFINEETKEILPIPYRNPMDGVNANPKFEIDVCSKLVKDKLTQRQFLLPSQGINARFGNCGEIIGLLLLEVVENDNIVLLFKVKFSDETYTSGYYDTVNEIFYDMWKESNYADLTHIPLESIVLQSYLSLSCELTKEERLNLVWFKEIKDVNNLNVLDVTTVYYEIKEHSGKGAEGCTRHFDRSRYIAQLMDIKPFLRNLPNNASASEEAIATAKKLGITLPRGKTLVRGFTKKVYTSE